MAARFLGGLVAGTLALHPAPVLAATYACRFGDLAGVSYRDGAWRTGQKAGAVEITFLHVGDHPTALRRETGQSNVEIAVLNTGPSIQFVSVLDPSPSALIELTTINRHRDDGPRPAMHTVHTTSTIDATDAFTDFDFCTLSPPDPTAPGYKR